MSERDVRPVGRSTLRLTRREVGLVAVLMLAAHAQLLWESWRGWQLTESWTLLYQAATLGVNYPEFGAVRRGLVGTLIHWSGLPLIAGTAVFHVIGALLLVGLVAYLLRRAELPAAAWWRAAGGMALLFVCWGEDAGRPDMTVAALVLLASIFLMAGRPLAWTLTLLLGLGVHENVVVLGLPFAMVLWVAPPGLRLPTGYGVAAAALAAVLAAVLVALAAYAIGFDLLPHVPGEQMRARIAERLPEHTMVALGLYFGAAGNRGLMTAMCLNGRNPMHVLQA